MKFKLNKAKFVTNESGTILINNTDLPLGKIIKEKANNRRTRYGDKSKLANRTSEIEKVTFNNKLSLEFGQ